MRKLGRIATVSLLFSLPPICARGQDSQSLGDVGRQAREQKSLDPSGSSKPARVVSDDDTSANPNLQTPAKPRPAVQKPASTATVGNANRQSEEEAAERVKAAILAQKDEIRSIQEQIDKINQTIHFRDSDYPRWNQRQRHKQEEVERLGQQLEREKKKLEEMQEKARKQGFGNTVYDP